MTVSTENPLVNAVGGTKLNAQAAEFVPGSSRAAPKGVTDSENLKSEILNVIRATGMTGIRVTQIPHQFRRRTGRWLVIQGTQFTSLSSIIDAIMPSIEFYDSPKAPTPGMEKVTTYDPDNGVVVMEPTPGIEGADTCPPLVVGDYANKVVRDKSFTINTEDLSFFKELVVAVVRDFCDRSSHRTPSGLLTPSPGLALSLFSAEWERYFRGALSLKGMRAKFGVMKLLPFILSCKELEMLGTHPEVRIRVKAEYSIPAQIAQQARIEAARMEATAPPTGPPADILSNYLTAASLLSELSSMSNATALSRPLPGAAGDPIDGLLPMSSPRAVLSRNTEVPSAVASFSVAPLEGMPDFEVPLDDSSDASASSCDSPPAPQGQKMQPYGPILGSGDGLMTGAPIPLSGEDLRQLLSTAIRDYCKKQAGEWENHADYVAALEKSWAGSGNGVTDGDTSTSEDEDDDLDNTSYRKARVSVLMAGLGGSKIPEALITPQLKARVHARRTKTIGVRVSSVRKLWKKAYPALGALDYYLDILQVNKLRVFLADVPGMTLLGRGSRMRVASTSHIAQYCPRLLPPPPHSSMPTSTSSIVPHTQPLASSLDGVTVPVYAAPEAASSTVNEGAAATADGEEEIEKLIKDLLLTTEAMTSAELEMEMARAFNREPSGGGQETDKVDSSSRVRE